MRRAGPILAALLAAPPAGAVPAYLQMFRAHYHPPAVSCMVCHADHAGGKMNAYGDAFRKAGASWEAFVAIGGQDADGDGTRNGVEIRAGSNPGDPASTPKAPGGWLRTVPLGETMPLEALGRMFPGIGKFEVREVTLSARAARAVGQALGAPLTRGDQFATLYFPVDLTKSPPARVGVAVFPAAPVAGGLFLGSIALGADGLVRSAWGGIFRADGRDDLSELGRQLTGRSSADRLEIGADLPPVPGRGHDAAVAGAREFRKALLVVTRALNGS